MAKNARNVRPGLSDDPRDKLAAALGWHYGRFKESREYQMAPIYFDMLVEWHDRLTPDQRETCLTLADVIASRTRLRPRAWPRICRRRRGTRCTSGRGKL
jgi:hypothetical protein